jgi:glycosyltransferase involved in cell wall biosynthesis
VTLAQALTERELSVSVVTLLEAGGLAGDLRDTGVNLISPDMPPGRGLGRAYRLLKAIRAADPQVIYSMLVSANVTCAILRPLLPGRTLAWGVRDSGPTQVDTWSDEVAYRLHHQLCRIPDVVIFNSREGKARYEEGGMRPKRTSVVPNGVDARLFTPRDSDDRARLRFGWGARSETIVFGMLGNLSQQKGHSRFLRAAVEVIKTRPNSRFVMAGRGTRERRETLEALVRALGLVGQCEILPEQADVVEFYRAIDALVLASDSEGFPNVVLEAMACGTPCVVRKVGDAADIVGATGAITGSEPIDMAEGMLNVADRLERMGDELSRLSRSRVLTLYTPQLLAERTVRAIGLSESHVKRGP